MCRKSRNPIWSIILLSLGLIFLLSVSALLKHRQYETRGIPEGLPEEIFGAGVAPGVNVYLEQYGDDELDQTLVSIKSSDFAAVKQTFNFNPAFDWSESDRLIEASRRHNLILVPLLDGDPGTDYAPPDNFDDFANWAGEFAKRYGEHIDHYIVWDEPNLTDHWGYRDVNPAEYAALLTATAQAIRANDPQSIIVAAPLAPTVELGPKNIADHVYLQKLYDAGASGSFDIVAGKPYGFNTGPDDRNVNPDVLNFSRIILLREVMERNGDAAKALWAGNWGWNSLPPGWTGQPSIWGNIDEQTQANWTLEALKRARQEWPWMGIMFLENWEPDASPDDPRWGFSIANRSVQEVIAAKWSNEPIAYPGYHPASEDDPRQAYRGGWRFSPEFGADVGETGDTVTFRFWGTDVGMRVRRANYHARFYVTIDGEPANALPKDEIGAALVLNSPVESDDYLSYELVARGLAPGEHQMLVTAQRGTDQWSLHGFSVGYHPPLQTLTYLTVLFVCLSIGAFVLAFCFGRHAKWGLFGVKISNWFAGLGDRGQLLLTSFLAAVVSATGWLTWGEQALGMYRRLGDGSQLALTAAAASVFYISPIFLLYMLGVALLFVLIFLRPVWGLALVAFTIPFYVKPKPMFGYLFSPVEIYLLITTSAFLVRAGLDHVRARRFRLTEVKRFTFLTPDWAVLSFLLVATLSLLFTTRLDVATNEWRVVIFEPVIFYFLIRLIKPENNEMWTILDALILGGVAVSLIGLWQYATGQNLITSEGGLMRLRSVYGSPNNVALYLGRIFPILVASVLLGKERRRILYALAALPIGLAILLSFSKGSLFLGLPASLLVVLIFWRKIAGGKLWPWLVGFGVAGLVGVLIAFQIPQLAGRLNPQGATGFFRMSLWRSSINMIRDHPIFGVGLDNFLYEYRGRYIFDDAWQEPNLSHPHNILLDFATRLGLLGLISGLWLIWSYFSLSFTLPGKVARPWVSVSVGLAASLVYMLAHGLVDNSFFLVDLAFLFMFQLGLLVWMNQEMTSSRENP